MLSRITQNLPYLLTHELGSAIVKGKYKVNQAFPSEAELSLKYDVSKPTVRAAIKILATKGLVKSSPSRRTRVQIESQWDMFDKDVLTWILNSTPSMAILKSLAEMLSAVVQQAVDLAKLNVRYQDIEAMEQALARMTAAEKGIDDPLASEAAFYTSVLIATDNIFFVQLNDFISAGLRARSRLRNKAESGQVRLQECTHVLRMLKSRTIDIKAVA